jgi:hypothetical protein
MSKGNGNGRDRGRVKLRTPWLGDDPAAPQKPPAPAPSTRPPGRRSPRDDHRRPVTAHADKPLALAPKAPTPPWVVAGYVMCALLFFGGVFFAVAGNKEAMGAVVSGPLLLLITYPIARKIAATDGNPQVVPILLGGMCFKLVGALVRYWIAADLYHSGDFYDYDNWGRKIAAGLRHGHLLPQKGRLAGTAFMRYVTGFIYFVTPARLLSGFMVYAFLSFIGLIFFWRAYRLAISQKNDLRYLKWVILLPSLLYWPSAIGKDAFMVLAAGIASYGVASLLTGRFLQGIATLSLGIAAMCYVRPHIALVICAGLIVAVFVGRKQVGFATSMMTMIFVVLLGFVVLHASSSFFGLSGFNQASIAKEVADVTKQSSQGGSAFHPIVANNPIKFPAAAFTVIYRPMPIEAHSGQELATSVEGVVLLVLTIKTWKRSVRALRNSRRYPYFVFAFVAILVFVYAFSGISNFGILARQRTVIEPLLLVFLTLPTPSDEPRIAAMRPRQKPRFVRPPSVR